MNRKKDDTEVTNRKSSSEQMHKPRPEHALGALHGAYAHDVSPAVKMANGFPGTYKCFSGHCSYSRTIVTMTALLACMLQRFVLRHFIRH